MGRGGRPEAWDPEVIDQAIPELPEPSRNARKQTLTASIDAGEPPVRLDAKALRVWRGENPKLKEDGTTDTSATLVKIGRVVFDAGGERPVIVAALRERDDNLYRKYTGRADADQRYHEIVDELEKNGRN